MATRHSTPPPPSGLKEPPTPRLGGFDDSWEPYSPRKSQRVSSQRAQRAAQTPPPHSSIYKTSTTHSSSPSTVEKSSSTNMTGTAISPPSTISKKRTPKFSHLSDTRRVSGALSEDSAASAATSLGLSAKSSKSKMDTQRSAATHRVNGMLPTPAKTPKKRSTEGSSGISSIARNLFPVRPETVDEVMPSPKKGKMKYSGITLDSFNADESDSNIQIYTDSHERIPEVDTHPDNPFYGVAPPEPTKRASKRRKILIPGEGEQTLEEAEKRRDGLVYVFRGKKVFRKFSDADDDEFFQPHLTESAPALDNELGDELDSTVPARLRGPLTRSSIKPRLLFPSVDHAAANDKKCQLQLPLMDDDEEAVTDIEEPVNEISTPIEQDDVAVTPTAPRFAPFSPPATSRATRSGKKIDDERSSPLTPDMAFDGSMDGPAGSRRGKVSPFASWQRTKSGIAMQSKKREGEAMTSREASKKLKVGRA